MHMKNALLDLYHKHVGAVFDRQMRFADYLQTHGDGGDWGYDVPSGVLTFGEALRFDAPLLGSFAENSASWLWAWANRHIELPAANRGLADAVTAIGDSVFSAQQSIPCEDCLPAELIDIAAHVFGIVVAGELDFDAYYLMPYEGGCGVVVVKDERLRFSEPHPVLRISSIFTQAISTYPILDHPAAFVSYVRSYGLEAKLAIPCVLVTQNGAEVMTAEFDRQNRLVKLESTVSPTT
jgi:hypothetical protein